MKEVAIVSKTENELYAKVIVDKKDECSKCGMCMFPKNAKSVEIGAKNSCGASVGDKVVVETQGKAKSISIVLVFVIPLILLAISSVIGYLVLKSETWIVLLCLISLVLWYTILGIIDKKLQKNLKFFAEITQIVQKGEKNNDGNQ